MRYSGPAFQAVLDPATLALREAAPTAAGRADLDLEPAAIMATLLVGISGSLAHIPTSAPGGTRVPRPGPGVR
jgi:hypothetical protein